MEEPGGFRGGWLLFSLGFFILYLVPYRQYLWHHLFQHHVLPSSDPLLSVLSPLAQSFLKTGTISADSSVGDLALTKCWALSKYSIREIRKKAGREGGRECKALLRAEEGVGPQHGHF